MPPPISASSFNLEIREISSCEFGRGALAEHVEDQLEIIHVITKILALQAF